MTQSNQSALNSPITNTQSHCQSESLTELVILVLHRCTDVAAG